MCTHVESQGKKLWKLSIGQPSGPALLSARQAAAGAIMSEDESMHEYQDNGEIGIPGFAKAFVQANVGGFVNLNDFNDNQIAYFPTPGTKAMIGLIPLACGSFSRGPGKIFQKGKLLTMPLVLRLKILNISII